PFSREDALPCDRIRVQEQHVERLVSREERVCGSVRLAHEREISDNGRNGIPPGCAPQLTHGLLALVGIPSHEDHLPTVREEIVCGRLADAVGPAGKNGDPAVCWHRWPPSATWVWACEPFTPPRSRAGVGAPLPGH